VRALALVAAVSLRYREGDPEPDEVKDFDLAWDVGALVGASFPSVGLRLLGVADGGRRGELLAEPATVESVRYLFGSLGFSPRRRAGYRADMLAIEWNDLDYPLDEIDAPTLVLHGSEDANVPLAHSEKVAAGLPGARLVVLEGGGHAFFVLHREWLEERLLELLDEVVARTSPTRAHRRPRAAAP
jgi:pimeloyl-ACP methyl ester carboxylesterase